MDATLSNVVEHLESKDPNANIFLPAEIGQIKIGDLHLSDAPTDLALQAASVASGNQFLVDERRSGTGMIKLLVIEKNQKPGPPAPERMVEALNLTGYLSYMNLDVRTKRSMATSGPDAKADERAKELEEVLAKLKDIIVRTTDDQEKFFLKPNNLRRDVTFYPDADLLIVVGTPDELETVRKIVSALPGQNSGSWVDANGTSFMPLGLPNNRAATPVHTGSRAPAPATSQP
jgi:hypothetical protein